ncbi:YraN family protein [Chitinibacter tainanensis]|uniref:YraN family protein n=1 Tax=Chitinibacter tainanensis TaxID=230667 RepID=UPI000422837E|nr:YraN family protein [Chitinibacter tainanensis]
MNNKGQAFETQAAEFLQAQGLRIVARNWQCRQGEIDLIAFDGPMLVFIEVRMRRSTRFGGAAASITPAKQARWWASAQQYLQQLPQVPPCRFDAICIEGEALHWIKNCISG